MTTTITIEQELNNLAKDCFSEANKNWEAACQLYEKKIRSDNILLEEFISYAIRKTFWEDTRFTAHKDRQKYWKGNGIVFVPPGTVPEKGQMTKMQKGRWEGITSNGIKNYYEYPLRGGGMLGEAKKLRVQDEAAFHIKQGESNLLRGFWFLLISEKMKDEDKPVREILTNEELLKLQQEAKIMIKKKEVV